MRARSYAKSSLFMRAFRTLFKRGNTVDFKEMVKRKTNQLVSTRLNAELASQFSNATGDGNRDVTASLKSQLVAEKEALQELEEQKVAKKMKVLSHASDVVEALQ